MTPLAIVRAIRATGLTQKSIGERTGIGQSTISKIEKGVVEDLMWRNYRALEVLYLELHPVGAPEESSALGLAVCVKARGGAK